MKIAKVKPNDVTFDQRYQRDLDERRARVIAGEFDKDRVGVPVLALRPNGKLVAIDGQHRIFAAKEAGLGDEPMACQIIDGLSLQAEAEMFLKLNGGRKAVPPLDKYKARIVAKEPAATEIETIIRAEGLRIGSGHGRRIVRAISAVEFVYNRGVLPDVLRVLNKWLDGDQSAFDQDLLRGLCYFFLAYPDVDRVRLQKSLDKMSSAVKVTRKIEAGRSLDMKGSEAAVFAFRQIFNATRGPNLPPPAGFVEVQPVAAE